ncbi:hypothetical protein, partial [Pseudomonas viridiflava]|uniref:hypothetical protein n=1 Tax=Pseudomonas viridiflava TaxID=33069 RepID=UPI00197D30F1
PGAQRKAKVGADLLVSFVSTDKRNSRVRRETKRSALAVMNAAAKIEARHKILIPNRRTAACAGMTEVWATTAFDWKYWIPACARMTDVFCGFRCYAANAW